MTFLPEPGQDEEKFQIIVFATQDLSFGNFCELIFFSKLDSICFDNIPTQLKKELLKNFVTGAFIFNL